MKIITDDRGWCVSGVHTLQPVVQPVGLTMQMSPAKRRLSGPVRTFMTSPRHIKAAVRTVDDVIDASNRMNIKKFRPAGCTTGCKVNTDLTRWAWWRAVVNGADRWRRGK